MARRRAPNGCTPCLPTTVQSTLRATTARSMSGGCIESWNTLIGTSKSLLTSALWLKSPIFPHSTSIDSSPRGWARDLATICGGEGSSSQRCGFWLSRACRFCTSRCRWASVRPKRLRAPSRHGSAAHRPRGERNKPSAALQIAIWVRWKARSVRRRRLLRPSMGPPTTLTWRQP